MTNTNATLSMLSHSFTIASPVSTSTPSIDSIAFSPSPLTPDISFTNNITNTRHLKNILLILFRQHPTGISLCELSLYYHQTFAEHIVITQDLHHLLCTHPSINTYVQQCGRILYTLNPHQIPQTLKSFDPFTLKPYIAEHILRAFAIYPDGIQCEYFNTILQQISHFKLSDLVPSWMDFVASIPYVKCSDINGIPVFINTFNLSLNSLLSMHTDNICAHDVIDVSPSAHIQITEIKDDKSPFCEDHYSVFMGGLARDITTDDIRHTLNTMGFVVVSCTDIKYRKYGYSWITLSSVKEADQLIQMSPITMKGSNVDVRPYINRKKQNNLKPDREKILRTLIELLSTHKCSGLSIREIQPALYRMLSYRISGTDLVDIIQENQYVLQILKNEYGQEKIVLS